MCFKNFWGGGGRMPFLILISEHQCMTSAWALMTPKSVLDPSVVVLLLWFTQVYKIRSGKRRPLSFRDHEATTDTWWETKRWEEDMTRRGRTLRYPRAAIHAQPIFVTYTVLCADLTPAILKRNFGQIARAV